MKEPTRFITNEKGERTHVIISIEDYEEIIEALEDVADIRAYDAAKASGEIGIPIEQAFAEIERKRNPK